MAKRNPARTEHQQEVSVALGDGLNIARYRYTLEPLMAHVIVARLSLDALSERHGSTRPQTTPYFIEKKWSGLGRLPHI